jgi:Tol biopolymer transport system component
MKRKTVFLPAAFIVLSIIPSACIGLLPLEEEPTTGSFGPSYSPQEHQTRVDDQDQREIILTDDKGTFEKTLGTFEVNAAFAWSPDSSQVAFIAGRRAINAGTIGDLHVVNIETSVETIKEEDVYAFFWSPDGEKLAYFDQYHQSATIWSPDNNNLVLSFLTSSGSPGIAVVAASGQLEPRILAKGYLAFWSWK